jgi:hypothetical protein
MMRLRPSCSPKGLVASGGGSAYSAGETSASVEMLMVGVA